MQVGTWAANSSYYERNVARSKAGGTSFSFEASYTETNTITRSLENRRSHFFEAYEEMKSRNAASRAAGEKTEEAKKSELEEDRKRAPYDYLAEDGIIHYKGVTFVCDTEKNRITLGDVSDPNKCLKVSLKDGGTLMVNFDNLEDLTKAITMFSPEDQARIMKAITIYKMSNRAQEEMDDLKAGEDDKAAEKTEKKETTETAEKAADPGRETEDRAAEYSWETEDKAAYLSWGLKGRLSGYNWESKDKVPGLADPGFSYMDYFNQALGRPSSRAFWTQMFDRRMIG